MDAVAEQIFQDKRIGKDPKWNMNYIVNEWTKPNNLRRTLLFQATFHNNIDIVQALLDHGADVNVRNINTTHALYRACFNNNAAIARLLMNNGGDPNIYNTTNDITCMWYAALKGNKAIMQAMLEKNFDNIRFDWDNLINQVKSDSGYGAFHLVCENGHIDCLRYLWKMQSQFETQLDTTVPIRKSGNTGLLVACSSNKTETIKFLINTVYKKNKKFNINQTNNAGRSAVWFSCWKGNLEAVKLMLEKYPYVDINKVNDAGSSPFKVACEKNQAHIIDYLLTLPQCDPNKQSKVLVTPLMTSIQNGSLKTVRRLCKSPKIEILGKKDKWHKDALDYTAFYGEIKIFQILLSTLIRRFNVTNWNELEKSKFIDNRRVESLLSRAKERNNQAYLAYIENLQSKVFQSRNFNLLLTMLDSVDIDSTYELPLSTYMKDSKVANYLYNKCDSHTLNTLSNVINEGLTNQECGFNDSLLLLAKLIDNKRLSQTLENTTNLSLSELTTNEKRYNFFQNNISMSKLWITEMEQEKNTSEQSKENANGNSPNPNDDDSSNEDDSDEDDNDENEDRKYDENKYDNESENDEKESGNVNDEQATQVVATRVLQLHNTSSRHSNRNRNRHHRQSSSMNINNNGILSDENSVPVLSTEMKEYKDNLLYNRVRRLVIDNELLKLQKYIKDFIVREEKLNEAYWKELKTTIKDFNMAKGDKIRLWEVYSQYNIKEDLMAEKGVKPQFEKRELPIDYETGFDGPKEYDNHGYLSRLMIVAHQLNPLFQLKCKELFNIHRLGVPCTYNAAPPKKKDRCQLKASLQFRDRDWPQTGSILDLIRCSVIFETVADLIQAVIKFTHIVDRANQGGIIKKVIRIKNGFASIPDRSWKAQLHEFKYAEVTINVLLRTEGYSAVAMIAEIQFILRFMLNAKKKGHTIASFIRNEKFFQEFANIVNNKDASVTERQTKHLILRKNMTKWSTYLENILPFDKEFILNNESMLFEFLSENPWQKGNDMLALTIQEWKHEEKKEKKNNIDNNNNNNNNNNIENEDGNDDDSTSNIENEQDSEQGNEMDTGESGVNKDDE